VAPPAVSGCWGCLCLPGHVTHRHARDRLRTGSFPPRVGKGWPGGMHPPYCRRVPPLGLHRIRKPFASTELRSSRGIKGLASPSGNRWPGYWMDVAGHWGIVGRSATGIPGGTELFVDQANALRNCGGRSLCVAAQAHCASSHCATAPSMVGRRMSSVPSSDMSVTLPTSSASTASVMR
jgi:hypothetical protein